MDSEQLNASIKFRTGQSVLGFTMEKISMERYKWVEKEEEEMFDGSWTCDVNVGNLVYRGAHLLITMPTGP